MNTIGLGKEAIGPIKELQPQFNRSINDNAYYQNSLHSHQASNQNSAVFQSDYDKTD